MKPTKLFYAARYWTRNDPPVGLVLLLVLVAMFSLRDAIRAFQAEFSRHILETLIYNAHVR